MIKIKPYTEIEEKDKFLKLYFSMLARALPFYPEDILPVDDKGKVTPDYKELNDELRLRRNYGKITAEAKKIIRRYSRPLHKYLYEGMHDGHVNRDRLLRLLTVSPTDPWLRKRPFFKNAPKVRKEKRKELLDRVFRYKVFADREEVYELLTLLDVGVCPYCNRLFTTTVGEGKRIRPQLDHYKSKSDYPFLALSVLNLVPSCGVCNFIKSDDGNDVLYPYEEEMGYDCVFRVEVDDVTSLTGGRVNKEKLTIELENNARPPLHEHIDKSIEVFNLRNVYQSHRGYAADMLFQRYVFTDEMIKDLRQSCPELFKSDAEVREMLLMGRLDRDCWGERPLGKLTHDISSQLDELYRRGEKP